MWGARVAATALFALVGVVLAGGVRAQEGRAVEIGARRELFVDHALIEKLDGTRLVLHRPHQEEIVLRFDRPWEGAFSGYSTLIQDGRRLRMYYRGLPTAGSDGSANETTCVAESENGTDFTKPNLGFHEVMGSRENNVILANSAPVTHNFCPFLDTRPGVPADQRYKGLGGTRSSGLIAFASPDGLRWRRLQDAPIITEGAFDSQNVPFWSEAEQQYVCYFRTFKRIGEQGYRWVSRTTSPDFLRWTPPVEMSFGDAPPEHLYTNQTHPYFRAPHLYISTAARFMPGRQVVDAEEARAIQVHPDYFKDTSDAVLITSRGGHHYDRTFLEAFIRPGIGLQNWVSRTNYPTLNVVRTGDTEMSVYVQQNYGQPTAHIRRYSLRLDGFASVQAAYAGGEMRTRPLVFRGKRLLLNFATSAPGGIRVEIQDPAGKPLPGYSLEEAKELIGNEIERAAAWKGGVDVSALAGRPVRLRFVMKDADLYAMRFE